MRKIQDCVFVIQISLMAVFAFTIMLAIILSFTPLATDVNLQNGVSLVGGLSLLATIAFCVFVTVPVALATGTDF